MRVGLKTKLMQLDQPPAKIRSKSDSNRLLIDFFDPISAVRSIVATISIRIRAFISTYRSNFNRKRSIFIKNWSNLSQNVDFGRRF